MLAWIVRQARTARRSQRPPRQADHHRILAIRLSANRPLSRFNTAASPQNPLYIPLRV